MARMLWVTHGSSYQDSSLYPVLVSLRLCLWKATKGWLSRSYRNLKSHRFVFARSKPTPFTVHSFLNSLSPSHSSPSPLPNPRNLLLADLNLLMADSQSTPSPPPPVVTPLSSKKENMSPIGAKIAELGESRAELLTRIQGLKQDLQSWRTKLDTQVKTYREELSELKKSLNVEVDQLKSEFQDLRTTLQQQQEDVTASLRSLGLQDVSLDAKESQQPEAEKKADEEVQAPVIPVTEMKVGEVQPPFSDDNGKQSQQEPIFS